MWPIVVLLCFASGAMVSTNDATGDAGVTRRCADTSIVRRRVGVTDKKSTFKFKTNFRMLMHRIALVGK